jgi:hypothetical protein
MPTQRKAVLFALLAVTFALLLLDARGSPREMMAKVRNTMHDLRGDAAPDTLQG